MSAAQRFSVLLSGRKPPEDALVFARQMFADMKGCEVTAASEGPNGMRVTLGVLALDDEPFPPRYIQLFGEIVTERRGYRILGVTPIFTGNLSKTVESILRPKLA